MLELAVVCGTFAVIVGIAATVAELARPARPIAYRDVVLRDAAAFGVVFAMYLGAVAPLSHLVATHIQIPVPLRVARWPLAARILTYYLVADLGSYLMHRAMHTKLVWRIHKWHHAPRYMYWFAGARATVQQQLLFNATAIFASPLIGAAPDWVYFAIPSEVILRNNWMHLNVTWRSGWIEWIFVTPRYHHVHHSADRRHRGNFGSLFTLWDRLFGTYIAPDSITRPLRFGTGEADHPLRLVAGV